MSLPFFFTENYDASASLITLNEETSKHVVQVLRMQTGEQINLTDGKGNLLTAQITEAHKRNCVVKIQGTSYKEQGARKTRIAISLVKNASRFEWFLEKATEIGVSEIIPLICERTERQHFRYERMKGILVSAMLQSMQVWLPVLREPVKFEEYVRQTSPSDDIIKLIAHCEDAEKQQFSNFQIDKFSNCTILIGPEGDFTPQEIQLALQNKFQPVALGETRLRTETAGMAAAVMLCVK
ncbi:MAG: 16S rRNA (uracil(1498)-N(3))-methyltransferase [Chitinophagaceae bacterium]|nr:16S rRNA (uracil(1498)-N(3))-methyltransferase [Chitinophagaceae bacterium]